MKGQWKAKERQWKVKERLGRTRAARTASLMAKKMAHEQMSGGSPTTCPPPRNSTSGQSSTCKSTEGWHVLNFGVGGHLGAKESSRVWGVRQPDDRREILCLSHGGGKHTPGKGAVLATKAVGTQGKGGDLATKAAEHTRQKR